MALYCVRTLSEKKFFFFCGDRLEWDKLIVKNCKAAKNVYVCDPYINRYRYPKEIKLITSKQTAKRLLGIRLEETIVFINADAGVLNTFFDNEWLGCDLVIVNGNIYRILSGLTSGTIEPSSRRNIKYIKKYK